MSEEKQVYMVFVDGMDGSPFVFVDEELQAEFAGELIYRGVDVVQEDVRLYETRDELAALIARVTGEDG